MGNAFDQGLLQTLYNDIIFDNIIANWLINYAESVQVLQEFFLSCKILLKPGGNFWDFS